MRSRVDVGGVLLDAMTTADVVGTVDAGWGEGTGGWIVTPNVDIWRRVVREPASAELVRQADLVVADGMPLVWAARLAGDPLPERVTGSGLVEDLSRQAAARGLRLVVVGGGVGDTAQRAGEALAARHPGLQLAGAVVPEFGFERDEVSLCRVVDEIAATRAELVLLGLGFPKQELLAHRLRDVMPSSWILGCGGGVAMAAGEARRSPRWAQRAGLEWVVRLVQEPRRLARRYLVDDAPAAVSLLGGSLRRRLAQRRTVGAG